MAEHECVRPSDISDVSPESLQRKASECGFCAETLLAFQFDIPKSNGNKVAALHRCLSLSQFKTLTIEQAEKRAGTCDSCSFLVELRKRRGWDDHIDTPKSSDY